MPDISKYINSKLMKNKDIFDDNAIPNTLIDNINILK